MIADDILFDIPFGASSTEPNKPTFNSFFPQTKAKQSGSVDEDDSFNWTILVYTSALEDASTDANVYIQVFGNAGSTDRIELTKKYNKEALFEDGSIDRFNMKLSNFGKPLRIKVGHDNSGTLASWHLDRVPYHFVISIYPNFKIMF